MDQANGHAATTPMPANLIEPPEQSVADRTKFAVDQIVQNVCEEFSREAAVLRQQLDEFEKLLLKRAAQTKSDMHSYVSLVNAGHELTEQISARLNDMYEGLDNPMLGGAAL